ncbi:MAG: hypothetical protein ACLPZR_12900 [Solirubrobacteraceae bacterium]
MPRRRIFALALAAIACAGCGQQASHGTSDSPAARRDGTSDPPAARRPIGAGATTPVFRAHPQVVEPVAGSATPTDAVGAPAATAGVSVDISGATASLPQPQTNAQIRQALAESGMTASLDQATLTTGGLAVAPVDAPLAVQEVIAAGNEIARLPYRWGGGHMTYEDTAYDCSGSLSYVLAAAGLLDHTVVSGQLEHYGDPGPGKWITIFANAGHTFMYVAGLRFDTVALAETGTRWSDRSADEPDLSSFSVRHPAGL